MFNVYGPGQDLQNLSQGMVSIYLSMALNDSKILINTHDSPMFLLTKNEFKSLAKGNKTYRMASFYKEMRKKYNILLDEEGRPFGERWSFDDENIKKFLQEQKSLSCLNLTYLSITQKLLN